MITRASGRTIKRLTILWWAKEREQARPYMSLGTLQVFVISFTTFLVMAFFIDYDGIINILKDNLVSRLLLKIMWSVVRAPS